MTTEQKIANAYLTNTDKCNTASNDWFECYITTIRINNQHQIYVGDKRRLVMFMQHVFNYNKL